MSFTSLLIHSVTVITPGATGSTDRYGNLVPTETSVTEQVRIQPVASEEDLINRDTRTTRFLVFAKSTTTITGLSRLTWGTRTLRVVGEPRPFYARAALHHYEADCEEILGG